MSDNRISLCVLSKCFMGFARWPSMFAQELLCVAVNRDSIGRDWDVVVEVNLKWFSAWFPTVHHLRCNLDNVNRRNQTVCLCIHDDPSARFQIIGWQWWRISFKL